MRPEHAGIFHVTTRSIAEEHIFRDDRDYLAGVQLIGELSRDELIICHGFCLMPTHYHLLASFDEGMLKRAIHRLNRRYAVGFNRRHDRRGHVFDSPYTSVEIIEEAHAEWIDTYIAENPPRRPWPWSSYDAPFSFVKPRAPCHPFGQRRPGGGVLPSSYGSPFGVREIWLLVPPFQVVRVFRISTCLTKE